MAAISGNRVLSVNTADSASFQSLHVIRSELVATIEQAARDLEIFVSEGRDARSLNACIAGIKQINGIVRLLEFTGASMLSDELLVAAKSISATPKEKPLPEKALELISNGFFVLTRYLEYVQQTERKIPVILIPYINELRKYRREVALPESYFYSLNIGNLPSVPKSDAIEVSDSEFAPLLTRLRHMYQLGLLGVLRDRQIKASLGLMRRAVIRLQRLGQDKQLSVLWWLSNIAIDAMLQEKMEIIEPRKTLLSRIDRVIRQVQKGGFKAYAAEPPKGLIKELVYIILLSGHKSDTIGELQRTLGLKSLNYNDHMLAGERRSLRGPSAQTISSLVRVLGIEINNIKKVLESAAQGMRMIDDIQGMTETLNKIAETLSVVGLVGPSSILKDEISKVQQWEPYTEIVEEDLDRTAKTMLYLESAVMSLEHTRHASTDLSDTSEASQNQIITTGELAQAEKIVLQECESGILLTKRAITAYSESGFDSSHISNIPKTLTSVRGGLQMLKRARAAHVVQRCNEFVEQVLVSNQYPPALKELLETFADAIISVEYFFDTAECASRLDDSVLQIAEESLAALGYPLRP